MSSLKSAGGHCAQETAEMSVEECVETKANTVVLPVWTRAIIDNTEVNPSPPVDTISIVSYNVLLPNSSDGWWTYKMYDPRRKLSSKVCSWQERKQLLASQIAEASPDIISLQEVAPDSFETDFDFLKALGYDNKAMHKKGRFRPAFFWKGDKVQLQGEVRAKDRCLVAVFKSILVEACFGVVNNHLQAGNAQAQRRLRQIHEGIETLRKLRSKLIQQNIIPDDLIASFPVVCCGDFNNDDMNSAVHRYLLDGVYTGNLSSKPKINVFGKFEDVYKANPFPTLYCPELISLLCEDPVTAPGVPSRILKEKLSSIYKAIAASENEWTMNEVESYLLKVNGKVGRGSEYRSCIEFMNGTGTLTESDFLKVYGRELQAGKYWGVFHDLYVLGEALDEVNGRFEARYDYCYVSNAKILDILKMKVPPGICLPFEGHPSDHLPVGVKISIHR
eukprot:CAMPEP_0184005474 /NCGR_PEP_ID=MMETSP0954-20121128/85_1 /TAXON_ID=627963 /ORGANISM="Aplanochytrium sp, Strain PBS07" /LENGTH=446 /DNA_ID=CAMNT_0026283771 /DNA_START=1 /DNA_END=1341 /DNA_ORIENTATION=+